jgi:hypothetical protein
MKKMLLISALFAFAACTSASKKGAWNETDRSEALKDVKEFSSALETVGTAKAVSYTHLRAHETN